MSEWKETLFGDLLQEPVRNGIYKKKEFHGRGAKIVNMGELFAYARLTDIDMKRVELTEIEKRKCLLNEGDLIFARRSLTAEGAGKCSIIKHVSAETTFESSIIRARPNRKKSIPDFLYYYFCSPYGRYLLGTILRQVAVAGITGSDLMNLVIKVPDIQEQKAIASVLSSLDDKIDLLHRQNKTLEAMAETLFRQWFDEKDCNGTVSQLISIQNGYAFKSKDFNEQGNHSILKIKNISASIVDIERTDFISTNIAGNIPERFKVRTGDILIAMTGAEIGKLGIVPRTNKTLWLNQRVGLLSEKHKGAKYLAYIQLKSEFGQDYIQNTAAGSAQPNISGTGIENCGFPLVSDDEIKNYSEEIDSFYEKLIFNLGQIRTLETLRDTLLPKLMSGEVRVDYP